MDNPFLSLFHRITKPKRKFNLISILKLFGIGGMLPMKLKVEYNKEPEIKIIPCNVNLKFSTSGIN